MEKPRVLLCLQSQGLGPTEYVSKFRAEHQGTRRQGTLKVPSFKSQVYYPRKPDAEPQ